MFERLFGAGEIERDPVKRARQEKYQKSVLDSVLGDAKRLQNALGASDRRKLDEYLYAMRDIETRIQRTENARRRESRDGQAGRRASRRTTTSTRS